MGKTKNFGINKQNGNSIGIFECCSAQPNLLIIIFIWVNLRLHTVHTVPKKFWCGYMAGYLVEFGVEFGFVNSRGTCINCATVEEPA